MSSRSSRANIIFYCAILFFLIATTAFAGPGLDILVYGRATYDGVALGAGDTGYTVSLKANGVELCSYVMGSDPLYGDYYVLKVPTDNGLLPARNIPVGRQGDEVSISINNNPVHEGIVHLAAPGVQTPLNVSVTHDNRVEVPSASSCSEIEAAGLVCDLKQECSETVPAGSVISQNPVAGSMVELGTTVSLLLSKGSCQVAVPDAATCEAITAAGLVCDLKQECSSTVLQGGVLSLTPAAGSMVQGGSTVTLVLSTGPCLVPVPNAMSCTDITTAGLACDLQQECSTTIPLGGVIRLSPAAGTMVQPNTSVSLVLSTGPCKVTVPSALSCAAIEAAGLVCNTTQACHDSIPAGNIITQIPVAGSLVDPGSEVQLVVSTGPCRIRVPNVEGMTEADARGRIADAQLAIQVSYQVTGARKGLVFSQSPQAGIEVDRGAVITVVVSLNNPPVANAGNSLANVPLGAFELDGTGSTDIDQDTITYQWTVVNEPSAGAAALDYTNAPKPVLTINRYGTYDVELVVNDGETASAPAYVRITTYENLPPVAEAGQNIAGMVSDQICLDGSTSYDPNTMSMLNYSWSIITRPAGSTAQLNYSNVAKPCFTADMPGVYVAQLVVNDGELSSALDTVTVNIQQGNLPPVADPGQDRSVFVNSTACLDGSGSYDPEGHGISYSWAIIHAPNRSQAQLDYDYVIEPCFIPDVAGDYVIQLIVNDGFLNSIARTVTIRAVADVPPIADAGFDVSCDAHETICLDGSKSHDPQGNSITYSWQIITAPARSLAVLDYVNIVDPCFIPDVPGDYVIRLIVDNVRMKSTPDTVRVTAFPQRGDLDHDGDVDNDDMKILLSHRNQKANMCLECDLDGDGTITVLDSRILATLCTRKNCAIR